VSCGAREQRWIRVNGQRRASLAPDVAALLSELGHADGAGIAVALNGTVVPRSRWEEQALVADDDVEIVGAVQGG